MYMSLRLLSASPQKTQYIDLSRGNALMAKRLNREAAPVYT
jgi:hypothetical protein